MANRQQRRAQAKQEKYKNLEDRLPATKEARLARLMQQGISPADLEREYKQGFNDGFKAASAPMIRSVYAATALAAHELFKFGRTRCTRLLNRLDFHTVNTLTSTELIDEVYDKIGLRLRFDEPFDRVEEAKKKC